MFKNIIIDPDAPVSVSMSAEDLQAFAKEVAEQTVASLNKNSQSESAWLSPDEVCERLNVSRPTLWRWEKEGYLTPHRFGRRTRYKESDVDKTSERKKRCKQQ